MRSLNVENELIIDFIMFYIIYILDPALEYALSGVLRQRHRRQMPTQQIVDLAGLFL